MVTVLTPVKRRVSICAKTTVSSPGARVPLRAVAVVQPHDTRTPDMLTGALVLLTRRNGWVSIGPRGTEPKSLFNSSNRPSAQELALTEPAKHRPTARTKL